MPNATQSLQFVSRARVRNTGISVERVWRSTCDRFRIIEIRSTLGLPPVYYAAGATLADVLDPPGRKTASIHHRTRAAAERTARHHFRKGQG